MARAKDGMRVGLAMEEGMVRPRTWSSTRKHPRFFVGLPAVAVLLAMSCAAPTRRLQHHAAAPAKPASTDAVLYDEDFWARQPASAPRAQSGDGSGTGESAREPRGEEAARAAGGDTRGTSSGGAHGGVAGRLGRATAVEVIGGRSPRSVETPSLVADVAASDEEAQATATGDEDIDGDVFGAQYAAAGLPGEDGTRGPLFEAGGASVTRVPQRRIAHAGMGALPGHTRLITNFESAIHVPAGRSVQVRLARPAERVAIADPDVAEVVIISQYEILINGLGRRENLQDGRVVIREAQTSVIVWDHEGNSDKRTLYVNRSREEQILLEVTVAEINRSALERYGLDFNAFEQGQLLFSTPAKIVTPGETLTDVLPGAQGLIGEFPLRTDRLTFLWRNFNEDFTVFIEALQQENLAKVLARPVLLARSGEEAHLRVGGEVPVVYATANVATITFKEFGTLLTFTPEFTDDGRIDLRAHMEVSEPTSAFSTGFAGFEVPAFVGRRAETRVKLEPGQTLLVGGLFRETVNESEEKVPYLGDIPILGFAFRKTIHDTVRTETIMTVRPQVAAASEDLLVDRLPTDRGPLTREEVRTRPNEYGVTRPRLGRKPLPAERPGWQTPSDYVRKRPE